MVQSGYALHVLTTHIDMFYAGLNRRNQACLCLRERWSTIWIMISAYMIAHGSHMIMAVNVSNHSGCVVVVVGAVMVGWPHTRLAFCC